MYDNYKLVWCDEFDYEGAPDPTKWSYETGGHGWGNNESQYYTDNVRNCFVKGGKLTINTLKEKCGDNEYTSAKLTTYGKQSFLYGRFDIRARLPKGAGSWPAIWMLPDEIQTEEMDWPLCGEIDIMEHVGKDENMIHVSLHSQLYNHILNTQRTHYQPIEDVCGGFHDYGMEWTPEYIEFFCDGCSMKRFTKGENEKDGLFEGWPFSRPLYLILNVAVGGNWGGPVDDSQLPYAMEIEYVRIYQKKN